MQYRLSAGNFTSQGIETEPQASILLTFSSFRPCFYYPLDDRKPIDNTWTIMLAVLWLFSIKKTPCSPLPLSPVCDQAAPVNSGHVAAPTFAQLSHWIWKVHTLPKEASSRPLFPIAFDEYLITQILLEVDHALSSQRKSQWGKLYKVLPLHINFCVLPVISFCLVFLPFWLIFFFNCTLLSFSSPSDPVICFTVSLDTWVIGSLLLLPCSFPYSMSNHSIFLKTLSSCSEVHFGSSENFPFSG